MTPEERERYIAAEKLADAESIIEANTTDFSSTPPSQNK